MMMAGTEKTEMLAFIFPFEIVIPAPAGYIPFRKCDSSHSMPCHSSCRPQVLLL